MSELDYRIEHFDSNLVSVKGKRIYLYGLGKNTEAVIRHFDTVYDFQGVIAPEQDADRIGGHCLGKQIFSLRGAIAQEPDVILIAAQMYSAEKIYERISDTCREADIRLMDLYGCDQIRLHDELKTHVYQDLQGWAELTEGYDIVSFSLVDTVLVRDIFHNRPAEMRPVFFRLLKMLSDRGTMLIGIEEDYYPHRWYEEAFASAGFDGSCFEKIYIREHTERFFREIKESFPGKRILHIGASELEDVIMPRLCGMDSYKMVFFDRNSLTAFATEPHRKEDTGRNEWQEESVRQMIRQSDGLTCDVFGTLLMRRTVSPSDVFALTALTARRQGVLTSDEDIPRFIGARTEVQKQCGMLDEIYSAVGERMQLDRQKVKRLIRVETETEAALVVARRGVAEMLEYAHASGKKVILVSDMYLPAAEIRSLLEKCGIRAYDDIAVSGEYRLSKPEGLFTLVKEKYFSTGDKLVHIGDDRVADGLFGEKAGFKPVILPSPYEYSSVKETADAARSVTERFIYGMVLAHRYADPCRKKADRQQTLYDYGFCAVAPAIIGWMFWFIKEIERNPIEKVLFSARDGYLFREAYDRLKPVQLPESVYYYTSRHAAFLACADREETAGYIAAMDPELSTAEVVSRYYDIEEERQQPGKTALERIRANFGQIHENADKARLGLQAYWDRTGLNNGAEYAFFDFVSAGTTQRMIEEIAPFKLTGYYFGRNNNISLNKKCNSFLSAESKAEKVFFERYMEMEYYLMSPEPSLRSYRQDGSLEFSEEYRSQEEIEDLEQVHRGVRDFIHQFEQICSPDVALKEDTGVASEFICRLYLDNSGDLPQRDYYDDWSMQWLN